MMSNGQKTFGETHTATGVSMEIDLARTEFHKETVKVVTCPICRAVYVPSSRPGSPSDSLTLLESAFLCVCHFCLHCQRPSCPQCWDASHHLCATCCASEHLVFRPSLSSFVGLTFAAPALPQSRLSGNFSFICLRDGHLDGPTDEPSPTQRQTCQSAALTYPGWLQEIMRQPEDLAPPEAYSRLATLSISEPGSTELPCVDLPVRIPSAPPAETPGVESGELVVEQRSTQDSTLATCGRTSSILERVEDVLLILTSLCLAFLLCMIILALHSPGVNTLLFSLLHVDIRSEVNYLWQIL